MRGELRDCSSLCCAVAGRFGLAPTANKPALGGNGLKLTPKVSETEL